MDRADLEQWKAREVARLLALVETERRYYQEIVASIPVGLLVLSSDLSIISSNRAIRKIFGLRGGDALRGRLDSLLPAWVLDRASEVLKTGVSQSNLHVETESAGIQKVLRVAILTIRNWDDDPAQEVLLNIEDLTGVGSAGEQLFLVPDPKPAAIIRDEAAPAAPETRVEKQAEGPPVSTAEVVANLDVILWAFDIPTNRFVLVSPHAERVLGFPVSHWMESETFWTDRIHSEDRAWVAESYVNALRQRGTHACEFRAGTADGRTVWLRETSRLLRDPQGDPNYLIGLTVDVTERRLLEDQLVQSERVEAVAKLASRLAHDLNNMLMILTGYGEELLSETPSQSALRADIQEIIHATERMTGLTTQLLAFARRPAATGVSDVTLEPLLSKMGYEVSSENQTTVKADPGQLEQAITAVVEKARVANHDGGKITVTISQVQIAEDIRRATAPLHAGSYGLITVSSVGHAMSDELRTSLFEAALSEKDAAEDSTAVSHAYGIVRQWGGDISVASGKAEGTVFHIYLPLVGEAIQEQAEPAPEELIIPVLEPDKPHVETILVVEDEAGIRALVRKILHRQGYEILEAPGGEEALALSSGHAGAIDLLITDMVMPNMGGRELAEKLTAQRPDIKVLYVSGYTDDAGVYAGDFPPGTAFLQKPFTLGSLLEKVKEVLSAR